MGGLKKMRTGVIRKVIENEEVSVPETVEDLNRVNTREPRLTWNQIK